MAGVNRTELGRVYYMTTRLVFPHDKDEWVKQEPIAGASTWSLLAHINELNLSVDQKRKLASTLECSWKDKRGVWVQIRIETTKRNQKWGDLRPKGLQS